MQHSRKWLSELAQKRINEVQAEIIELRKIFNKVHYRLDQPE